MYVQITTKCNMSCAHCCFAATRKGEHMPLNIFQKALQVAVNRGDHLTIGGGEPTMHPDFFKYLELAREESRRGNFDIQPFVVTNGKNAKVNRMMDMLEQELEWGQNTFSMALSQDQWHDSIEREKVARAMRLKDRTHNARTGAMEIRSVSTISPVGRGRHSRFDDMSKPRGGCACETALVDPQGIVWACGCKKVKLGSIWDEGILDDYDENEAHKEVA